MNFDETIMAHHAWKMKLSEYLKKPDGSLQPSDIRSDNKCELGQWIYGEGAKWSLLPEYSILRIEHAKFHQEAAEVVRKAESGKSISEDLLLGGRSDFALSSTKVMLAIMGMKFKAGAFFSKKVVGEAETDWV